MMSLWKHRWHQKKPRKCNSERASMSSPEIALEGSQIALFTTIFIENSVFQNSYFVEFKKFSACGERSRTRKQYIVECFWIVQGSWRNRLFWTDLPSKPWKTSKFSVLKRVFREKSRYPADFELKIHFVSIKIFSFWGRMKNPREVFQAWEGSEASNSKTGDSSGQTAVQHFTWLFLVSTRFTTP